MQEEHTGGSHRISRDMATQMRAAVQHNVCVPQTQHLDEWLNLPSTHSGSVGANFVFVM